MQTEENFSENATENSNETLKSETTSATDSNQAAEIIDDSDHKYQKIIGYLSKNDSSAESTNRLSVDEQLVSAEPAHKTKNITIANEKIQVYKANEQFITSKNYPNPYPKNVLFEQDYMVAFGSGVEIRVIDVNLDPNTDFLLIRAGSVDDENEKGHLYTGLQTSEIVLRLLHTNQFFVRFYANQNAENVDYTGFKLAYSPFGSTEEPTPTPTPEPNYDELPLEFYIRNIVVPVNRQNNETWIVIRDVLSDCANEFIDKYNITSEPSM